MRKFITVAVLALFGCSALAKTPVQSSIGISACYPVPQASLSFGIYNRLGIWHLDAGCLLKDGSMITSEYGDTLSVTPASKDLIVRAGYDFRLVTTPKRVFNLYAGLSAFGGYKFYDGVPVQEGAADRFLYGFTPSLSAEVWIFRRFAFTLSGVCDVVFPGPTPDVSLYAGAGFRYLIGSKN